MKKLVVLSIVFALAACSAPPTAVPPTPPPAPTSAPVQPTAPPPPPPPTSIPATQVPPTQPAPTATVVPPTAIPPTQAAPTQASTTTPVAAPTTVPGLYVNDLQLTPAHPAFNQNISFKATFNNATGSEKTFRWLIYIWRADIVTHTDNETSALTTGFPVGSGDYMALGTYRYGPTGRLCEFYFARVGWLDANNKVTYFMTPNGQVYEKGFEICDSSIIPTPVPQPPPPTVVPSTPGPGLFVTGLRLQPFETPQHNMDTTFFPTFLNNSNTVQNFTWKVYIFKADTPANSTNETTGVFTSFPVGSTEVQALGTFRYGPTGYQCDSFFARVGFLDANNKIIYLSQPNGQVFHKGFQVCN